MSDAMDTIPPRVNSLEQEVHTLKHRTGQLESLPVRVGEAEKSIVAINNQLSHIDSNVDEIKSDIKLIIESQPDQREGIPYGVKMSAAIIGLVGAAIGLAVVLV